MIRNIGRYATCFGLLRMPKLEELKYKKIEHFTDSDYDIRNGIHHRILEHSSSIYLGRMLKQILKNSDSRNDSGNDSVKSKLDYKDKSIRNQRKQTEAKRLEERNKAAARKKAEKTKAWSIQKDKVS